MFFLRYNLHRWVVNLTQLCIVLVSSFCLSCSQEATNTSPIIDRLIVPSEVLVGVKTEFHVIARDSDGDSLSYTWSISQGQTVESSSRTATWVAPDQPGAFIVSVFVSDGISEPTTRSKQILVKAPNKPPEITELRIPKKVSAGEISQLSLLAVDPNQDPLIFTWKIDDVVLEEGPKTEIEWQVPTQEGEVTIQVIVSDGIAPAVKRSNVVIVTRSLLIVPGLRAGGITLGDSFKTIKDIYGEPNIFEKVDDLFFFAFWQPDQGISGFIDEQTETVTATFVQSPNQAKTAAGNGVNSTLDSVEQEFGLVEDVRNNLEHWYWTKGIEFDVRDQLVDQIFIFRPLLDFERLQPMGAPALAKEMIGYPPTYYKQLHHSYTP
ncbi:PKD domain-containing protein [Candidatus Poribacteria bacterium]|nr:PKD domain-containing protein [Candidatus Poribacteria bacterium]